MRNFDSKDLDYALWAEVNVQQLPEKSRERFIQMKAAIIARIDGMPVDECSRLYKTSRQNLYRCIKRCLIMHEDGRVFGFRALINKVHIQKAKISKLSEKWTHSGERDSFRMLVERHPQIFDEIISRFLKRSIGKGIHESRMPVRSLHLRMLDMLRAKGVDASQYPFNVKSRGIRSMTTYLKNIAEKYGIESAKARHHEDVARRLSSDTMKPFARQEIMPYQRVSADGHRLDLKLAVEFTALGGVPRLMTIDRLWVFVLMDDASRAVIGYSLSLDPEYTKEDVLHAIKSALIPWKPRELKIKGLCYANGGGLPNGVFSELAYAGWQEFLVDNAKSNLAIAVKERLHGLIGCAINSGPVNMPERRGVIERFFGTLEEYGIHRLPSTTGSSPKDGRRSNPDNQAIRKKIMLHEFEDLLDVTIANYNATPNNGALNGLSPLEFLRQFIDNNGMVISLDKNKVDNHNFMEFTTLRKVAGGISKGKSPHVNFGGVTYSSGLLRHSYHLVGTRVSVSVNTEDLRHIKIFLENGEELGILTAQGAWGVMPHDLKMRRNINRLKWEGKLAYFDTPDPVMAYMRHLEEKVSKSAAKGKQNGGRELTKLERTKRIIAAAKVQSTSPVESPPCITSSEDTEENVPPPGGYSY